MKSGGHNNILAPAMSQNVGGQRLWEFSGSAKDRTLGLNRSALPFAVDKFAVFNPQLHIRGVSDLRLANDSVMPQIITGSGTNASIHMIAGRAAKLILG